MVRAGPLRPAALTAVAGLLVAALGACSSSPSPRPHGTPRPPEAGSVTVTWVGDMSLSSDLGLPPLRGAGPLSGMRGPLEQADLALGNLEGTLGSGGRSKCRPDSRDCVTFRAPSSYARMYAAAGFDVLNLANNHAYDFGPRGWRATARALAGARIGHAGGPAQVEVRRVRGASVALIGFAPYPGAAPLRDLGAARTLVRQADRRADVVVVMMHAGAEGADQTHTPSGAEHAFGENRGRTRAFAHAVVDAGADLVVGSGPHVIRGIELYRDRLVAYSLGNFLAYNTLEQGGALSLSGILRVRLDASGRTRAARWVPIRLVEPGVPRIDPTGASTRLVGRLSREDFGARGPRVDRRGRIRLP
jgi:Bacterial capsule synthesis protein PGA_cap